MARVLPSPGCLTRKLKKCEDIMPCRCDGYESGPSDRDKLEESRMLCCQAQSLAHKLGLLLEYNKLAIPDNVKKVLDKHRKLLAKHKKDELEKDIEKSQRGVIDLESRIKQIKGLGGTPTKETCDALATAKSNLVDLKNKLSSDLLGGL